MVISEKNKKILFIVSLIVLPLFITGIIFFIRKYKKNKEIVVETEKKPLLYEEKIPNNRESFSIKVREIAAKLNTNPNSLMFVMNNESGLRADIENKSFPMLNGYATGLIQFTPDTAAYLGTSTALLKMMSNVVQLDYVLKYLLPFKGKLNTVADVYNAIFFPVAVGKPDSFVMSTKNISAGSVAKNNPIFDLNKNNEITVGEIKEYIKKKLPSDYQYILS